MTNKNVKNYLLTTAGMVLFAAVSCFAGGILQAAMGILISVLLGMQTTKYHYGYLLASSSAVFLIPLVFAALLAAGSFFDALIYSALLMVPAILMGLTLGFAYNLKLSFFKTVLILTVIYLIGSLTNLKIADVISQSDFSLENIIASSVDQVQAAMNSTYAGNQEMLEAFQILLGEVAKMMLTLSPAIFTLLSLLISYICSVLFKNYQMRSQRDMSFWPAFYQLRADRILSVLFLVIFLLNAFAPMGMFYDLSINVIVILAGIFFCFGLAYIDWRMRFGGIKALPRRLIVIACIPLCMMFFMLPLLIITTIGVLDGIFDFRSRTVKKYHDGEMPRQ